MHIYTPGYRGARREMRVLIAVLAVALVPADALRAVAGRPRAAAAPRMMAKELVIWDCDGVLVDSEALLKTSEVEALHAAGFTEVTVDDCNRMFSGFAPEAGAVNFEADFGQPLPEHFFRDQIAGAACAHASIVGAVSRVSSRCDRPRTCL